MMHYPQQMIRPAAAGMKFLVPDKKNSWRSRFLASAVSAMIIVLVISAGCIQYFAPPSATDIAQSNNASGDNGKPSLSLGSTVFQGNTVSINGVTLPQTKDLSIERIHWSWGDGTEEDHWFPNTHTYTQEGDFTITVTTFQSDGKTESLVIHVVDSHGSISEKPLPSPTSTAVTSGTTGSCFSWDKPILSLLTPTIQGNVVSINGVTLPENANVSIQRIHWSWGDGTEEDHWFPNTHTYTQEGDFTVTVTTFQSDGKNLAKSMELEYHNGKISKKPITDRTFSGTIQNVAFKEFPTLFFDQSCIDRDQIAAGISAQYLALKDMHNGIAPYSMITLEYKSDVYGETSPTGLVLGDAAFPENNNGNPPWQVMGHEQGHNFFGETSSYYIKIATPGPFLQESLAVLSTFYTYHYIQNHQKELGIQNSTMKSFDYDFRDGKAYLDHEKVYNDYISSGSHFDPDDVRTSQVLDYQMIRYGDQYGWNNYKNLSKAFDNTMMTSFDFYNDGVSAEERSTYIVAALSASFHKDFRDDFRKLNFPIDDSFYNEAYEKIDARLSQQ